MSLTELEVRKGFADRDDIFRSLFPPKNTLVFPVKSHIIYSVGKCNWLFGNMQWRNDIAGSKGKIRDARLLHYPDMSLCHPVSNLAVQKFGMLISCNAKYYFITHWYWKSEGRKATQQNQVLGMTRVWKSYLWNAKKNVHLSFLAISNPLPLLSESRTWIIRQKYVFLYTISICLSLHSRN